MQLPLFEPTSNWRPPATLVDMDTVLALDTETRDPYLRKTGPSFKRGAGEVIGIALADKNTEIYLPIAHQGGDNLDRRIVIHYVKTMVERATEIRMANALYDLGWLHTLGISVNCPVRDVQVAEALLDEERYSYSLDNLSKDYLGVPKDETHLRAVADAYGLANKGFDPKRDMYKLAARHVGRYGEVDARNTYDIYDLQLPKLLAENLGPVWELECEVTKVLHYMTLKGVPVDTARAEEIRDQMVQAENNIKERHAGVNFESSGELADYFKKKGIQTPKTKKGNPSVTNEWLEASSDPLIQEIAEARKLRKIRSDYIEKTILGEHRYNGRIHAGFKQIVSDDGGTRSGRLSSSDPNLQQVPKRSSWGKKIRTLYIAEPGALWCKADYSSQEPRLQVHYAMLENLAGAKEACEAFTAGVKLYTFFEETTGLPYDTCKMLCLGIGYGMGKETMSQKLNISISECEDILNKFNRKAPFLKQLFDRTMRMATDRGYIRTIYGRRAHFNHWSIGWDSETRKPSRAYKLEQAKRVYGDQMLERAFCSKALNRLIQGGSADQSKLAMVECFKAGLDLRLPVHDEINAMVQSEAEAKQLCEIMEHVIELKVPTVADLDLGPTWC